MRACVRVCGHPALWVDRLEVLTDPGDAATRADAVDEVVDRAAGLLPDLRSGRPLVHRRVVRVAQLVWPPVVRVRGELVLDVLERTGRAERRIEEVDLRAKLAADQVALEHRPHLGHDDDALVALGGGNHRVADARIPRREVDDRGLARRDVPTRLRLLDHVESDPVLEGAAGVLHLQLAENRRLLGRGRNAAVQLHHWRVADCLKVRARRWQRSSVHDCRRNVIAVCYCRSRFTAAPVGRDHASGCASCSPAPDVRLPTLQERRRPGAGMGGRHAATTQGF